MKASILLAMLAILAMLGVPAIADARQGETVGTYFYAQAGISAGEAAERVRAIYGGRVISVTPVSRGGQTGYMVRVLVDGGRVKTVFVDGSGSVHSSD